MLKNFDHCISLNCNNFSGYFVISLGFNLHADPFYRHLNYKFLIEFFFSDLYLYLLKIDLTIFNYMSMGAGHMSVSDLESIRGTGSCGAGGQAAMSC